MKCEKDSRRAIYFSGGRGFLVSEKNAPEAMDLLTTRLGKTNLGKTNLGKTKANAEFLMSLKD